MATNFPTSKDSYTTLVDGTDYPKAAYLNDRGDAIEALETKVGIDGSTVTTSHDYKISTLETHNTNIKYAIDYSSFATAVSDIGSTVNTTLIVSSTQTLTADVTVTSNIYTLALEDALFTGEYTITFNGPFDAGLYEVFDTGSTITVKFKNGSIPTVYPQWWGAKGDGSTNDTTAVSSAFASFDTVTFVNTGLSYIVDSITLNDNKTLLTTGIETTIEQSTSAADGTRILNLLGSNIKVDDVTLKGQIATSGGEQNHGIIVNPSKDIRNINIGNINGQDLRGDVLYIGGTAYSIDGVTVGSVYGNNILRNIVSITGGHDIYIRSITGTSIGYVDFDIEPTNVTDSVTSVVVDYIKGSSISMRSNDTTNYIKGIKIGYLDLASSRYTNSDPAYSNGSTPKIAFALQNARNIIVDYFKAVSYDSFGIEYVHETGDLEGENIIFNYLDFENCSETESTYHSSLLVPTVKNLIIRGGNIKQYANDRWFIYASSSTKLTLDHLDFTSGTTLGSIIYGASQGVINDLKVDTTEDIYVFNTCSNLIVSNSNLTAGRLAGASTELTFQNCDITASTLVFNSDNQDHFVVNTTINSDYYLSGPYTATYTKSLRFGQHFLWVDSNGQLRIKSSAPTSDTDGTVVGTQS